MWTTSIDLWVEQVYTKFMSEKNNNPRVFKYTEAMHRQAKRNKQRLLDLKDLLNKSKEHSDKATEYIDKARKITSHIEE